MNLARLSRQHETQNDPKFVYIISSHQSKPTCQVLFIFSEPIPSTPRSFLAHQSAIDCLCRWRLIIIFSGLNSLYLVLLPTVTAAASPVLAASRRLLLTSAPPTSAAHSLAILSCPLYLRSLASPRNTIPPTFSPRHPPSAILLQHCFFCCRICDRYPFLTLIPPVCRLNRSTLSCFSPRGLASASEYLRPNTYAASAFRLKHPSTPFLIPSSVPSDLGQTSKMKSMKNLSMNKMLGSIKRRTTGTTPRHLKPQPSVLSC